jgi:hypothetical protein
MSDDQQERSVGDILLYDYCVPIAGLSTFIFGATYIGMLVNKNIYTKSFNELPKDFPKIMLGSAYMICGVKCLSINIKIETK